MAPRVLVVAPLYHPDRGGLGRQAVLLTERLAELGVSLEVATREMRGLPEYAFSPAVPIHRISAGRPEVHNYETPNLVNLVTSLAFSFGLVRLLFRRRKHVDAIHVHGASLPLLILLPFAKLLGIPVLALVAATHQGVEAGDMLKHPLIGRFLAWAFARVDGYVAITAEVEELLVGEGVAPGKIARIPFFVDVERWKPFPADERARARRELGFEGRTVVVASGRLVPRKGGDTLIRAFAAALPQTREAAPLLVFLGDGPERSSLELLARAEGIADLTRFAGFVEDVPRWLAAADALVLASRIEGLPNALLEALGMGLPCIATRIAGAEEVIDNERNGVLFPVGDEPALARALVRVARDAPFREALGAAAADKVRRRFARDAIVPRYLEVYEDLAAHRAIAREPLQSKPAPVRERRVRPLRAKLAALAVSTFVGLLGAELLARLVIKEDEHLAKEPLAVCAFHEQRESPATDARFRTIYVKDDQLGFGLAPNVDMPEKFSEAPNGTYRWRTNALGLRDDRDLAEKKSKRILVLGDSMTFGMGVEREQAFPAVLEKRLGGRAALRGGPSPFDQLRAPAPAPPEVVNGGCCMWGQREENAFLEHRAAALQPDVVIVEFTVANDVLDDLRYHYVDDRDPEKELVVDASFGTDLENHPIFQVPLLAEHSRAYRALVWRVGRHVVRYRAMKESWRLERAASLIRRSRDLANGLGARFVLVIAPTAAQLEHSMADRILRTRAINDYILAAAHRDGISTVDPTADLEAVYRCGRSPYFPVDQHWNQYGHEAVASALAPQIAELLK